MCVCVHVFGVCMCGYVCGYMVCVCMCVGVHVCGLCMQCVWCVHVCMCAECIYVHKYSDLWMATTLPVGQAYRCLVRCIKWMAIWLVLTAWPE